LNACHIKVFFEAFPHLKDVVSQVNQLPANPIERPQEDLVSKCKNKLIEDNPHLAFEF